MNKQLITNIFSISLLLSCTGIDMHGDSLKKKKRVAEYPVADIFVNRWSARAMSGAVVSEQELHSLFEAARWAPSSYNSQPWRFVYAKRNTPAWNVMFDLLVDFNKQWAKSAGVLVVIISKDTFDHNGQISSTHSFDVGAAWQNLALQGSLNGLIVHGMGGFDCDRAKEVLHIPDGYTIEAMAAIGKPGSLDDLPESMRGIEKPSDRNAIASFAFEGLFKAQ